MKHVKSQDSFAALDVAQVPKDDGIHRLVDHENFFGIVAADRGSLSSDNKSGHYVEDINAILDSWNAYISSEIARSPDVKPEACPQNLSTTYSEDALEPLKRIKNPGPPKRFRRRGAMWKTMTSRIVERASENFITAGFGLC